MADRERGERTPVNPFFDEVRLTLSDQERGDYEGVSDLARVYRTKRERNDPALPQFVEAIGMVIEGNDEIEPGVKADAVHLAYHLEIWELAGNVDRLKASPLYEAVDYIKREVNNFFAYKELFHDIPHRMEVLKEFNALPPSMQDVFTALDRDSDTSE